MPKRCSRAGRGRGEHQDDPGREIALVVAADAQILTALVRRSHSGTEYLVREEESVSGRNVIDVELDLLCTRPAGDPDSGTSGPYAVNN